MKYLDWILSHEHLSIDFSELKKDDDTSFRDYQNVQKEINTLKKNGLSAILDLSTLCMKRNDNFIAKLANESKIKVYRATGLYKEPFIDNYFQNMSVDEIVKYFEKNINNYKILGEIGTSKNLITSLEQKSLTAFSILSLKYNLPLYTHTTLGSMATEQTRIILASGVNPKDVVIGHQDLNPNKKEVFELLKKGFNIGIDTIGKNNYALDEYRLSLINEIVKKGYIKQIILSLDITRKSHLRAHGGSGYLYFIKNFIPKLESIIGYDNVVEIISKNPKTIFKLETNHA